MLNIKFLKQTQKLTATVNLVKKKKMSNCKLYKQNVTEKTIFFYKKFTL